MRVYPAEEAAGLRDTLLATARLALASPAEPRVVEHLPGVGPEGPRGRFVRASNLDQPDLFPVRSLLVSTGFNLNGDFFTAADTWAARRTPEDKPDNLEHDRDRVVGHTTDAEVRAADGSLVPDDAPEPPDAFSIWDTGVVYRFTGSEETQKARDEFVAGLAAGDWWVSMEALFDGFDYVLVPPPADGRWVSADLAAAEFVERNASTAFLTKHLAAYGGSGSYKGRAVGRVLRGLTFAGKGYVGKPANPPSAVFTLDGVPLSGRAAAAAALSGPGVYPLLTSQGPTMPDADKLSQDLTDARAQLAAAQAELAKAQNAGWEAKVREADDRARAAEEAAKAAAADAAAKQLLLDETAAAKAKADEALAAVTADRDALAAEKAVAAAEKAFAGLVDKVKAAYAGADEAKVLAVATTLKALPADVAEAHLAAVAELTAALKTAPVKAPAPNTLSLAGVVDPAPETAPNVPAVATAGQGFDTLVAVAKAALTLNLPQITK